MKRLPSMANASLDSQAVPGRIDDVSKKIESFFPFGSLASRNARTTCSTTQSCS